MKNNKQPIIVGLDLGTTKTVAIAAQRNASGKLEILGYGETESVGIINGVVQNLEQCMNSINLAIKKCVNSNPELNIKDVYIGISGQHIKNLKTRGERTKRGEGTEISKKDIDMLISDQYKTFIPDSDQIIDVIPHSYVVDNTLHVEDPVGTFGSRISANFNIITSDRNAIRNIKRSVEKAGLNIKNIILQPLASAAAVTSAEDREEGVVVVDIGGGTTDVAVFCDGVLRHTAVIPCGGVNVTNDIRNGLGVLRSQAELLKIQYGNAIATGIDPKKCITVAGLRGLPNKEISLKMLAIIIEEAMQEIIDYIVYHLQQLNLSKPLNGGIILTGGGALLRNISQLTKDITGMNVRIGNAEEHIVGNYAEILIKPSYATCIGLILKGYAEYENTLSLVQPEIGVYIGNIETNVSEKATPLSKSTSGIKKIKIRTSGPKTNNRFSGYAVKLKKTFMGLFEEVEEDALL
jgi:cell division protein FtsA